MNLTDARTIVRQFARNAGDSSVYTDAEIDRAILFVGNRFCRIAKPLKDSQSVTVTATTGAVALSSLTYFRPERMIDFLVTGYADPLSLVDYSEYHRRYNEGGTGTGRPEIIAMEDNDGTFAAVVYPAPSTSTAAKVRYWLPFTSWTPGASGSGVTLNLPDEVLYEILPVGPVAILQHNQPEQAYASASWRAYLEIESMMRSRNINIRTSSKQSAQM